MNRRINPNTKSGPWAAIKRYWEICGCLGDPVYLLTVIRASIGPENLLLARHGRAPPAAAPVQRRVQRILSS